MLSQKQLYVASRLYVVASKAGAPFDLATFTKDRSYALATISSLASQITDSATQALIAEAMISMTDGVSMDEPTSGSGAMPALTPAASVTESQQQQRYVGKLR